jgi:cysteine-rich repeat protein
MPLCGDNMIIGGEVCDDGNATDGDGCSSMCKVEPYFRCKGTAASVCTRIKILHVPSDTDDANYRAAIAAITGGPVDYVDGSATTPTVDELGAYDCVHTYAIYKYLDEVTLGNNLATFVDAGGNVVLGNFATYTTGNALGGLIMKDGYCPVTSPTGMNHLSLAAYAGDGKTFIHNEVKAYEGFYRDILVLQGTGIVDGTYVDGEIAHAYRPDFKVIYSNGSGASGTSGTGDWPRLIANSCAVGFLQ